MNTKVAIVTNASNALGRCMVRSFSDSGYRVVAASPVIDQGQDPDVIAVPDDTAQRPAASRVVATALATFGRIDTVVNNVEFQEGSPLRSYSEHDFDRIVGANLANVFHVTQLALAPMSDQGSGHIISVASAAAVHAPCSLASMTMGALGAVTRSLAAELRGSGVRVNAVLARIQPSPLDMRAAIPDEARMDGSTDSRDQRGEGQCNWTASTADAVLYLEMARQMSGSVLHICRSERTKVY